jgi:mycothiol synthase
MHVHLRPAALRDVPAIGRLARARELAFGGHAETTDAEIAHDLVGPDVDLALDTLVAEDATGRVIGYGDVIGEDAGRLTATVWTPPDGAAATRAAEQALLDVLEARSAGVAAAQGLAAVTVQSHVDDADTERTALLRERGYRHTRTFHRMVLPREAPSPSAAAPPGIDLRPIDPRRDAEAAHELLRRAFAEHDLLGVPADLRAWRHLTLDEPRWVPGPSLVAIADGVLVGAVIGFPEDEQGWIRHLGVAAPHRGEGLGAALLAGAIAAFRERGLAQVALGVDSGNRSGATRLYERVGMRVAASIHQLERQVAAGRPADG